MYLYVRHDRISRSLVAEVALLIKDCTRLMDAAELAHARDRRLSRVRLLEMRVTRCVRCTAVQRSCDLAHQAIFDEVVVTLDAAKRTRWLRRTR